MFAHDFQETPGLQTLLQTNDFAAWEAVVSQSLGHHRSQLHSPSATFQAKIRQGRVADVEVLTLQGYGRLEIQREQCDQSVLWLPLEGWSRERINGEEVLAESGMALLFRPGDAMQGFTSEAIRGVSILLPANTLGAGHPLPPLLHQGVAARRVIAAAWQLVSAAAQSTPNAGDAAPMLQDALQIWAQEADPGHRRERVTAQRRRTTVEEASRWMSAHLGQSFSVVDLSTNLQVSARTLQSSFQQELGCSPMALAKRLRLRRLRQLLQDPSQAARSVAELMQSCGLLACGATARDYRHWCGESPSDTRRRCWDGTA